MRAPEEWKEVKIFRWVNGKQTRFTDAERKRLSFVDVEVTTRILDYSLESFMEIQKGLHNIIQTFPLLVPPTAGLHVHVGNQKNRFPLQTILNFGTLISSFQRFFNELHPLHRLLSEYCTLPQVAFHRKDRHPLDMANVVNACKTVGEFLQLFTDDHRDPENINAFIDGFRAYSFSNMMGNTGSNTIEFRQHEGTLTFDRVARWVNLVIGLTCVSHTVNGNYVFKLVHEHASDENSNILVLLPKLYLPKSAEEYKGRLHIHSADLVFPDLHDDFTEDSVEESEEDVDMEDDEKLKMYKYIMMFF